MTDRLDNGTAATAAEIEAEIESTRAALGETVAALAAKADVKARLSNTLAQTRSEITDGLSYSVGRVAGILETFAERVRRNPVPWLLGAAAVLITLVTARSRRR